MRKRLIRFVGQRCRFRAVFIRFGKTYKPGRKTKRYMLIEDVVDLSGRLIAGHMWVPLRVEDYVYEKPRRGDTIQFEAEVNMYHKGTKRRRRLDYGLCKPTDVQCVEQSEMDRDMETV